jgi:hypothetical protein
VALSGVCLLTRAFTACRDLPAIRIPGPAGYARAATALSSLTD